MNILVVNCGSSSIKLDVLDAGSGERRAELKVQRVGTAQCSLRWQGADEALGQADHAAALAAALPRLRDAVGEIAAVGHRVVHGGERFAEPARIDDAIEAEIQALVPLAPLHLPANLAGIRA